MGGVTTRKPSEVFGPYLVYERLGVGGMATVHRASKRGIEGFERVVALKRLLPHLADDADFVRSFVREAKLASMLQHANVVQIYELGRVGAAYFMAMEMIDGYDVRQILQRARRERRHIPVPVVLSILLEMCDALDYAHSSKDHTTGEPLGLVHRDVSPSNLIVTPAGHLKVIDFGIAKATSNKLRTETGRVKGKLGYMSPESVTGRHLDARSDLFSVGVVAHELLTVRPLFSSRSDYETLRKIQASEVVPPSVYNPAVPEDLDDVVLRALARYPRDRFQTAADLRDALDTVALAHGLRTTTGSVAAWLEQSFGTEPPTTVMQRSAPPPVIEEDDEITEIAWGASTSEGGIVLIPGVPDVSDQIPIHFDGAITEVDPVSPSPLRQGSSRAGTLEVQQELAVRTPPPPIITFRSDTPSGQPSPRPRAVGTTPPPDRPISDTGRVPSLPTDRRGWFRTAAVALAGLVLAVAVGLGLLWENESNEPAPPAPTLGAIDADPLDAGAAPAKVVPARVVIKSTPPGLAVAVDGRYLSEPTPVTLDLEPGKHHVTLSDRGIELWSQDFDVEADTRYVLHAVIQR